MGDDEVVVLVETATSFTNNICKNGNNIPNEMIPKTMDNNVQII